MERKAKLICSSIEFRFQRLVWLLTQLGVEILSDPDPQAVLVLGTADRGQLLAVGQQRFEPSNRIDFGQCPLV